MKTGLKERSVGVMGNGGFRPKPDPKIRKDKKCAMCSKDLPAFDPFCSTACCRQWHGIDQTGTPIHRLGE